MAFQFVALAATPVANQAGPAGHNILHSIPQTFAPTALWHNRQLSTPKLVRPSGRDDLAEVAGARDRRGRLPKSRFSALLQRHPVPAARIVHRFKAAAQQRRAAAAPRGMSSEVLTDTHFRVS
jgi:hypothetical protein